MSFVLLIAELSDTHGLGGWPSTPSSERLHLIALTRYALWRARRCVEYISYTRSPRGTALHGCRMCRPEELRVKEGIPELRFGARGKGAALGIPTLGRGISGRVRNAGDLPYLVAAIEIQGLKQVGGQIGLTRPSCML